MDSGGGWPTGGVKRPAASVTPAGSPMWAMESLFTLEWCKKPDFRSPSILREAKGIVEKKMGASNGDTDQQAAGASQRGTLP